jgi:hypothetical protein
MGILSLLAPGSAPPAIREMQSMCQIDCDHDPLIKALNPHNPQRRRRNFGVPFRAINQRSSRRFVGRGAQIWGSDGLMR